MSGKRQKTQCSLASRPMDRGETPVNGRQRAEPLAAKPAPESPAETEHLMEEVCDRENLQSAWKRVRRNQGSPGVDGMTIDDAKDYLREHWPSIRSRLLDGTYQPQPVKRVEIPKPDSGVRKLGVPCVVDRLIQQALLQVLQERWDPTFSEHSYGFRPGRSAHQAVAQAQHYVAEGYGYVVDLDLEKFLYPAAWAKTNLALRLTPYEADRQTAPELPRCVARGSRIACVFFARIVQAE